jgi:hypothetical protein
VQHCSARRAAGGQQENTSEDAGGYCGCSRNTPRPEWKPSHLYHTIQCFEPQKNKKIKKRFTTSTGLCYIQVWSESAGIGNMDGERRNTAVVTKLAPQSWMGRHPSRHSAHLVGRVNIISPKYGMKDYSNSSGILGLCLSARFKLITIPCHQPDGSLVSRTLMISPTENERSPSCSPAKS